MTKQRRVILEIIRQSEDHLTADQIYQIAKLRLPSIAIGTVYRNLNLMVASGEIRRVCIPKEADRFDRNVIDHSHMVCDVCGEIVDVMLSDEDEGLINDLLDKTTGKQIMNYDMTLRYVCDRCKRKEEIA